MAGQSQGASEVSLPRVVRPFGGIATSEIMEEQPRTPGPTVSAVEEPPAKRADVHAAPTPVKPAVKLPSEADLRGRRSDVWKSFKLREVDGKTMAICTLCEGAFKYNTGGTTSNLLSHLKNKHGQGIVSKSVAASGSNQPKITSFASAAPTCTNVH